MKSKKASSVFFEGPRWIIDFTVTFITAVFILMVAFTFVNEKIDSHPLEADGLMRNLLYSDSCLAFSDDLGSHPGIVDVKKLSDENLKTCFSKDRLGYIVKLVDYDSNLVKQADPGFLLNKFLPICAGDPDFRCSTNKEYVLYNHNGVRKPGFIVVEVISRAE